MSNFSLKENLDELINFGIIEKIEEYYIVNLEVLKALNSQVNKELKSSRKIFEEKNEGLIDWVWKWIKKEKLYFPLEKWHFYLDGRCLNDFSNKIVTKAENEILVVNPNLNNCPLSEMLKKSCKRGIPVKVITRPPEDMIPMHKWHQKEYHSSLINEGIVIKYNDNVHGRIITLDRTVAIISSSDFSNSSVEKLLDTGIITLEKTVLEQIVNSILKIAELPETTKVKNEQNQKDSEASEGGSSKTL